MAHGNEAAATTPGGFRADLVRGRVGFFRVGPDATGRWWLIDPDGAPIFLRGVHGVRAADGQGDGPLPPDTAARLRTWHFNAVGLGNGAMADADGLPFMAAVEFCAAAPVVSGPGLRLPDVFDPEWPRQAAEHAGRVCRSAREARGLIGWVTDSQLAWAQPAGGGRPSLLQLCLSLEPGHAAYHAAWEFVLALHGGRLDVVARSWGVPLSNKEVVRERTRAETGIGTRGYLRDEARWTREFARRYFVGAAAAIRAADPHHLVLGCRLRGLVGPHLLAECSYPAVDVTMPDWRELPVAGDTLPAQPLLAGEVNWVGPEFLKLPTAARVLRLTSMEWMLRRARTALDRMARHPAVTGYVWGQWQDEAGEQPPFARGLVHVNGSEAREHTELLAYFNVRAEVVRGSVTSLSP